ncbi:N-terminal acetyltransferase [Puccinia graminis f. sp. tritici]|uniref:N-terminal acetyltransferase n=1 Tax=Puccinia graminis f. sp. tritici TaxID=56615 RepID=A0A5B0RU36_PUCGR|nr:N-terminal acetyltransferase [Puccinia graminis f. sp. tritici]
MSLLRPFEASDICLHFLTRLIRIRMDAYPFVPPGGLPLIGRISVDTTDCYQSGSITLIGHVSAITVAPSYRRLSLARELMKLIESASEQQSCYFVDLFVRLSNSLAISMYEHFGYSVYQRVLKYYSGGGVGDHLDEEDAFDMRKALSLDKDRKSVRENGREVLVDTPSF